METIEHLARRTVWEIEECAVRLEYLVWRRGGMHGPCMPGHAFVTRQLEGIVERFNPIALRSRDRTIS